MKVSTTLLTTAVVLAAGLLEASFAIAETTTVTTTRNLRGKVVHTRTVYLDNAKDDRPNDILSLRHVDHDSDLNIHNGNDINRNHVTKDPLPLHRFDKDSHLDIHNGNQDHDHDSKSLHHFDHDSDLKIHITKRLRQADPANIHHFDHDSHLNIRKPEIIEPHHFETHSRINLRQPERLVDPHPRLQQDDHRYVRVQGKMADGTPRTLVLDLDQLRDKVPQDAPTLRKNHDLVHHEGKTGNMQGESVAKQHHTSDDNHHHLRSEQHRSPHELRHETPKLRFEGHDAVEKHHLREHHYHPQRESVRSKATKQNSTRKEKLRDSSFDWKRDRSIYALPTGLASHYNQSLFDELHNAPFRVYAEALGHELDEGESFPVFALPQWLNTTGVFTGFSKKATPLIFENVQFLLHWDDIVASATSPVSDDVTEHIANSNFHASLIIGKSIGNNANVPFIGMVLSYYQFGSLKNVLVPFSKLEDFFDNTSEKHLLDPNTKSLEMAALHEMLEERRANSTTLYHPALALSKERKSQLEDLEVVHFQKLFQLLIRRSFLFAFGFADCLLNEPHDLRDCLDDTFYHLIEMETTTRGALDDQVVEKLAEINETFHSRVSEACVSVQGSGNGFMYGSGSGSCYNTNDLGAFVSTYATF